MFICGHYEGYDERIRTLVTDEYSIGDFVLTGGELAATVMIDATVRLLPDVLGNDASAVGDSHSTGLLEHPHIHVQEYIKRWKYLKYCSVEIMQKGGVANERILRKTYLRRPDLLEKYELSKEEEKLLEQIKEEEGC